MSHQPLFRTTWTDPVTGRHGHLVIDRLIRSVCGGGMRMRDGCSLEEVTRLAHAMTLKNGGLDIPAGGAKCGLDIDPHDPRAEEMMLRFVTFLRPIFESYMGTGEDMGTTAEQLRRVFARAGFDSFAFARRRAADPDREAARIQAGFDTRSEGTGLFNLVGGFGVAEAAAAAIEHSGGTVAGTRVAIQGFGSMGGAAARYLARRGARVIAVADAGGTILNPDGLDIERLLASRTELGEIDRSALGQGDTELGRDSWIEQEADLLVPAAIADCINEANCEQIRGRLVVEAANLPTTPAAEAALAARGVLVIPDFIANAGTNGWAWWVILGLVEPGPEAAFAKIAASMRTTVTAMLDTARREGITAREAAVRVALANAERNARGEP